MINTLGPGSLGLLALGLLGAPVFFSWLAGSLKRDELNRRRAQQRRVAGKSGRTGRARKRAARRARAAKVEAGRRRLILHGARRGAEPAHLALLASLPAHAVQSVADRMLMDRSLAARPLTARFVRRALRSYGEAPTADPVADLRRALEVCAARQRASRSPPPEADRPD